MSWGKDFMPLARGQVANRADSMPHKIATVAWYTGRKQVLHAPSTALKVAVSLIPLPVVGSVLNAGIDQAINKVNSDRQAKKRAKYGQNAQPESVESLRKVAKADAKNLKTLGDALDRNQVKLKDAAKMQGVTMIRYVIAVGSSPPTSTWKDAAWKAALAIYERERYEDKILILVEAARLALTAIEDYVKKSRTQTAELEGEFSKELDRLEQDLSPAPAGSLLR
jgi:hypothetical protein